MHFQCKGCLVHFFLYVRNFCKQKFDPDQKSHHEIEVSSEAEALYVLVHGKRKIIISCKLEKLLYGYRMI